MERIMIDEIETKKEDVSRKYLKRGMNIFYGLATSMLIIGAAAITAMKQNRVNLYSNSKDAVRYEATVRTIEKLKGAKEEINSYYIYSNIPNIVTYEDIETGRYLGSLTNNLAKTTKSLDDLIGVIESDFKELEKNPDVQDYKRHKIDSDRKNNIIVGASIPALLLTFFGYLKMSNANYRKRDKELKNLG